MGALRYLCIVADDYGIGPETSRGILELAREGVVTATVLLVNTSFTVSAVKAWLSSGLPLEMGWHPNLTLDFPLAPSGKVSSLIRPDGRFWPLGQFLLRVVLGRIQAEEVCCEFQAQFRRFCELVGHPPTLVNSHQHVSLFPPVGWALRQVLGSCRPRPYLRRVQEPLDTLTGVPGARFKRLVLTLLGKREARRQIEEGYPGADFLLGLTDPERVRAPDFFTPWLKRSPGHLVELMVHPGYRDFTLIGRDCVREDAALFRRVVELNLLRRPAFREACEQAGFSLISPSQSLIRPAVRPAREVRHAA